MSTDTPSRNVPSAGACAEAAAWIARLHGEQRSARVEAGFRRWLAASAEHRTAFEMANDVWVGVERLPAPPLHAASGMRTGGRPVTVPRLVAACAILLVAALAAVFRPWDSGLGTRVGEQRILSLEDGTRVFLNTASRIYVHYDRAVRRVELERGEAYFEVAKHPEWPFVVVAGGEQVVARGTAFVVRRDADHMAVTLVEGKVTVAPAGEPVSAQPAEGAADGPAIAHVHKDTFTLSPGERLTFAADRPPKLDEPALQRVTAWQRGQVILDHTPLADAVAEMNRYSDVQLRIEDPAARRAEVTGIFRVGDSAYFAQAVAETYGLRVTHPDRRLLVLAGAPRSVEAPAH